MGESRPQDTTQSKGQETAGGGNFLDFAVRSTLQLIVIIAIVGILAPLFTHSIASIPLISTSPSEIPIVLIGVIIGVLIPTTRAIFSKLVTKFNS